ncbi:MAG: diguanylate cyclase, partial [Rhodobacteraceae bacterium]|nr:diguanylate cyclase [Paracoccaceae bacterium]
ARLRIALLAIEQAAWALAATDARLNVVATRTEIDWALRQGNPILWAPSKLVLDTPGAPASADPLVLALWLADHLRAARLVLAAGIEAPAGAAVEVLRLAAV